MKELHDRLKSLIQEHSGSISMAEIARKANIDRSTLYKILRGERKPTASQPVSYTHLDVYKRQP